MTGKILWLLRKALLLVPCAIIAFWGVTYLRACLNLLLAPNLPVAFSYRTGAGVVKVDARSYVIDPQHKLVRISGLRLRSPTGTVVAYAKRVTISRLDLARGANQNPVIDIYDLGGNLVRRASGSLELSDLLPQSKGSGKSTVSYVVRVHRAHAVIVDHVGNLWRQRLQTEFVLVSGVGPDWVAQGTVRANGIGTSEVFIQNASNLGLLVRGKTSRVEAAGVLAHILSDPRMRRLESVRDLKFQRVVGFGPFKVFVPNNQNFSVQASVNASATQVTWKQYHADRLAFVGEIGKNGAVGTASIQVGANRGTGVGSVRFSKVFEAAVKCSVISPSSGSLPPELSKLIPTGIRFGGARFDGWLSSRPGALISTQGTLRADQIAYRGETALHSTLAIFASPKTVRADLLSTNLAGGSPTGAFELDVTRRLVKGFVNATNLELGRIARLVGTDGLSGTGSVRTLISGSLKQPDIAFVAKARGYYHRGKVQLGPDQGEVQGTFSSNRFFVHRGYLTGVDGILAVRGQSSSTGSELNLDVQARNVDLGEFSPSLSGVGSLSAVVSGAYRHPKVKGTARAVQVIYEKQIIPAASIDFEADQHRVSASRISALSGTMDLEGAGVVGLPSGNLRGKFKLSGIELAQFVGDSFAGILDAPTLQLNGTLAHPTAIARLEGSNLVAGDILVDNVEALVTADPTHLVFDHATANFAGGSISGSGSYDLKSKVGTGSGSSTALDLSKLAPALGETVTLGGSASIQDASFTYHDGSLVGTASGKLDQITANRAAIGDGNWSMKENGPRIDGSLSIGQLEPILRVVDLDFAYDREARTLAGTFDADRTHLSDIISASQRYIPEKWAAAGRVLFDVTGDLTIGAKFSGSLDDPDLAVQTISADNLRYKSLSLGTLSATQIARKDRIWNLPEFSLSGPQGTIAGQGTIAEGGAITAHASGTDLRAEALSSIVPGLTKSPALLDFSLNATGTSSAPDLTAFLDFKHVLEAPSVGETAQKQQDLTINVPHLWMREGAAGFDGTYSYAGFSGSFNANAPWSYQSGFENAPLTGHAKLDQRPLKDLPFIASFVDIPRSDGKLSGDIEASGTVRDVRLSGGLSLTADTLAFKAPDPKAYIKRMDDQFKSVSAKLSISPTNKLNLGFDAGIVRGGAISLNASIPTQGASDLFTSDMSKLSRLVMNFPVDGKLDLKKVSFRQSAPGGFFAGILNGSTMLGGTVGNPSIGARDNVGRFTLSNVDVGLPTLPTESGSGGVAAIDPTFNLVATLGTPAHVRSSTAELTMTGGADLRGSLEDPVAKSDLVVQSGSVRLPGGAIRLIPGGTLHFGYQRTFPQGGTGSLDVDLQGKTYITSVRYGQSTQRYDVTVDITGDVLQENGLHFDAISDPPDLSPDDVLGLLGQRNLVQNLNSSSQSEAQQQLRDALVGFALPSVLDPYTNSLAKSLGLDYISLEYNSLNLATLGTGFTLSPDFSLQYRQQVGTPPPGYRSLYDFRLVFAPRKGPPLFRKFNLSVGTDQDRPWKLALEYGTRFGGYSGPAIKNRTVLSSPERP